MDAKGTSDEMRGRTLQNSKQELQKQQEDQEQMAALQTFKALLQKAAQL